MHWILIWIVITGSYNGSPVTGSAEFSTKEACEAAATSMTMVDKPIPLGKNGFGDQVSESIDSTASCFDKGDKPASN